MDERASERVFPKDLILGIAELDDQHRAFFVHREALRKALAGGVGARDTLMATLRYLDTFVNVHFLAEEQYMRLHNYPGVLLHRTEHEVFAKAIIDLKNKALDLEARGEVTSFLAVEIEHRLETWFTDHVLGTDLKMVDYLRARP